MGVIFSAPVLPPDVATMAAALDGAGQLDLLVTRWCFSRAELLWASKLHFPKAWLTRPLAPVRLKCLRRLPGADFRKLLGGWFDRDPIQALDKSFQVVDDAATSLISCETTAVLGREDACEGCFRRAKEFNVPRIYQLPTAHYQMVQKLLTHEHDLFPEAFDARELRADLAPERLKRKDSELGLATHVLCPSSFVGESLKIAGFAPERITVLPLGTDPGFAADAAAVPREPTFLYVGAVSARKGVHRLLRLWKELRAYRTHRLRLIGDLRLPFSFLADHKGVFEHIPRMPRTSLVAEYSRARAFVFNALADGFGQVFSEAMACATPVLASRNSGAPDLVKDGEEGWLFQYGDDGGLGGVLDRALSSEPHLRQMGERARQRALQWTSDDFAAAFVSWVKTILARGTGS